MRLLVTVFDLDGESSFPVGSQICEPGQPLTFEVESRYLVAAGQKHTVGVSVFDADAMVRAQGGPIVPLWPLVREDGETPLVDVPVVWDVSFIPTRRLLADILADVVTHGLNNPEHGFNCTCMDAAAREIRLQVSKALPPDGRTTDSDWSQPIRERLTSKARIKHVLDMVLRGF